MLQYDAQNNLLTIQRRDFSTNEPYNVLADVKRSYEEYKAPGGQLEKDVNFLIEYIAQSNDWHDPCKAVVRVGPLKVVRHSFIGKSDDQYYPVLCKFQRTGKGTTELDSTPEFELFRMPYMDSRGVLNVNATSKVMCNYLTASEDVSLEKKDDGAGKLSVFTGATNMPIEITPTHMTKLSVGADKSIPLDKAIFALRAGEHTSIDGTRAKTSDEIVDSFSVIHNAMLNWKSSVVKGVVAGTAEAEASNAFGLWYKKQYEVSEVARANLNETLQLDRAMGYTLSRDVTTVVNGNEVTLARKGDKLTAAVLNLLKSHCVWKVYVKSHTLLKGMTCAQDIRIQVRNGQRTDGILAAKLNMDPSASLLVKYNDDALDSDVDLSDESALEAYLEQVSAGMVTISGMLSEAHSDFFYNQDAIESIIVKKSIGGQSTPFEVQLDNEIITNKTFYGEDIDASLFPGVTIKKDAWYVFDKNGKLVEQSQCADEGTYPQGITRVAVPYHNGKYITSDDLMALYSLCGWYISNPESHILANKDAAFLKTVSLFGDTMSKAIRTATVNFYNDRRKKIAKSITWNMLPSADVSVFNNFFAYVSSALREMKALETADTLNPVSALAHAANISTFSKSKNSVVESQRLIALPFNGRVCPYETPASGKIGLVNHIASGCKIDGRRLLTGFRKVQHDSHGPYVDFSDPNSVVYMDSKEQMDICVADCLSVPFVDAAGNPVDKMEGKVYIAPGQVLGIIPNTTASDDTMIPEAVSTSKLDYITYSPEQHCSSTALLMPFLGADDPARISFGLSMQKQAIYCQDNQRPRVLTHQYKDMFDQMGYYTIYAEHDGVCTGIDARGITVTYNTHNAAAVSKNTTVIHVDPVALTSSGTDLMSIPEFKKGIPILMKGMPGVDKDVLAPFNCKCIAVDEDTGAITLEETGSGNSNTVTHPCKPLLLSGEAATFMEYDVIPGQTFKKGQLLAHASIIRDGFYAPARNVLVAYIPTGYNYEDAVDISRECAAHYTSISASTIDIASNTPHVQFNPKQSFIHEGDVLGTYTDLKCSRVGGKSSALDEEGLDKAYATNVSGYFYAKTRTDDNSSKRHSDHFKVTMLTFNNQQPGDKMAGRHGNKGVASRLAPNSAQPMLKNGKIIDICLNPCGVPSRMNLGQNLEAHLGFIAEVLNLYIISDPFNGATLDDIRVLMDFAYEICNLPTSEWNNVCRTHNVPTDMIPHLLANEAHIREWADTFDRDGKAQVWDPVSQRWYNNPVTIGYAYFMKLEQQVDNKVHVRAGVGFEDYAENSLQPQQGRSRGGGQKMGEMELITLAAYGAVETLRECTNEKSDNLGLRVERTAEVMGDAVRVTSEESTPRANDVVRFLLEGMGVYTEVENGDNVSKIDTCSLRRRQRLSNFSKVMDDRQRESAHKKQQQEECEANLNMLEGSLDDDDEDDVDEEAVTV